MSIAVTWTSAKYKDRSLHIAALMLLSAVGNAIATGSRTVGARYFAMFLMPMGAISACTFPSSSLPSLHPFPSLNSVAVPKLKHPHHTSY